MKHKHHIIPKHMGGTDDPSNLIELTVPEHAAAHLSLYEQYGKKEDLCAYYMLSGRNQDPEFVRLRSQLGAAAAYKTRLTRGIGHLPFFGAELTDLEKFQICSSGGKVQGPINSKTGFMAKIQKMGDVVENGRKGGLATIASGKGAFGDPIQRRIVASMGGKVQGRRNAESGHLKRIAQLPSNRNRGMVWVTDGQSNEMIKDLSEIKDGWYRGKTQKRKV